MLRLNFVWFFTATFIVFVPLASAQTDRYDEPRFTQIYKKQKVVYHIKSSSVKLQHSALSMLHTHLNSLGDENIQIKVILHGGGLSMLLEPDSVEHTKFSMGNANDVQKASIDSLRNRGVKFIVCTHALRGKNVDYRTDLYNVNRDDIILSGVAELVRLQQEGWAYIKP